MTTSTKVNSFTILKTKNQFILLCWKKKIWRMCTNFWINPHNGKLPSRLAPAQYQNSLTPQLLSNIYWSKTKTSISLNRVYWYDTMCHIFSCSQTFVRQQGIIGHTTHQLDAGQGNGVWDFNCQMQYDANNKKTIQKDPCFIYSGGNGPQKCRKHQVPWGHYYKWFAMEYTCQQYLY